MYITKLMCGKPYGPAACILTLERYGHFIYVLGKQSIPINSCVIQELHTRLQTNIHTIVFQSTALHISLVSKTNTFSPVFTKTLITTYSGSVSIACCTIQCMLPDEISLKPYLYYNIFCESTKDKYKGCIIL